MKLSLLCAASLALAVGSACTAPLRPDPIGPGHPADPGSTGTAFRPAPSPFEITPTFDLPGSKPAAAEDGAPGRAAGENATDVVYTCPMHPEVRSAVPGYCPECGMALRPLPQEVHQHDHEHGGGAQ